MPVRTNVVLSHSAGYGQSRIGHLATFDRMRFDPPGTQTNAGYGNEDEQGVHRRPRRSSSTPLDPRGPNLQGLLETQLTRDLICQEGRLRHQESDQILRQQVCPYLLVPPSRAYCRARCSMPSVTVEPSTRRMRQAGHCHPSDALSAIRVSVSRAPGSKSSPAAAGNRRWYWYC